LNVLLQILAGGFYLLNKIFLAASERAKQSNKSATSRKWRIAAWGIYLLGLPAWVVIFIKERNWIAASVEASGAPSMLLGLIIAVRGLEKGVPKWLDRFAIICIPFGFAYSFYDFGSFTSLTQWLETMLVVSYLVGTYLLANERGNGYLWYIVMHLACGYLMWHQDYPWLVLQQVISLLIIVDAYVTQRHKK
jgi:hypothetical protein